MDLDLDLGKDPDALSMGRGLFIRVYDCEGMVAKRAFCRPQSEVAENHDLEGARTVSPLSRFTY
jgi:hypothetical protein